MLSNFIYHDISDVMYDMLGGIAVMISFIMNLGPAELQSCAESNIPVYVLRLHAKVNKCLPPAITASQSHHSPQEMSPWVAFAFLAPQCLLLACAGETISDSAELGEPVGEHSRDANVLANVMEFLCRGCAQCAGCIYTDRMALLEQYINHCIDKGITLQLVPRNVTYITCHPCALLLSIASRNSGENATQYIDDIVVH